MKRVWVIYMFMVLFNIMVMFTSSLGIFDYTISGEMSEEELSNISGYTTGETDLMSLIGLQITGTSLISTLLGGVIAAATHSIIPLLLGAFVGFFIHAFGLAYAVFGSGQFTGFAVNEYLLLAGAVGMGILLVATLFEYGTGGHNA